MYLKIKRYPFLIVVEGYFCIIVTTIQLFFSLLALLPLPKRIRFQCWQMNVQQLVRKRCNSLVGSYNERLQFVLNILAVLHTYFICQKLFLSSHLKPKFPINVRLTLTKAFVYYMARVNDLNVTKLRQKNVQCQQTNIVYISRRGCY